MTEAPPGRPPALPWATPTLASLTPDTLENAEDPLHACGHEATTRPPRYPQGSRHPFAPSCKDPQSGRRSWGPPRGSDAQGCGWWGGPPGVDRAPPMPLPSSLTALTLTGSVGWCRGPGGGLGRGEVQRTAQPITWGRLWWHQRGG